MYIVSIIFREVKKDPVIFCLRLAFKTSIGLLTEKMFNIDIDVMIVKTRQRLRPSSVRPGPMVRVSGALRARRCDTASWCRALTGIYKLFISQPVVAQFFRYFLQKTEM